MRSHSLRQVLALRSPTGYPLGDRQHLTRLERQGDPDPCLLAFAAHEAPDLVDLHALARLGHEKGLFQVGQAPPFCLSHLVKVLRLMPKVRAMPRMQARS